LFTASSVLSAQFAFSAVLCNERPTAISAAAGTIVPTLLQLLAGAEVPISAAAIAAGAVEIEVIIWYSSGFVTGAVGGGSAALIMEALTPRKEVERICGLLQ
jgi:hypothetical protein